MLHNNCETFIKWKTALRKEKKKNAHKRLEELSDSKGKLDLKGTPTSILFGLTEIGHVTSFPPSGSAFHSLSTVWPSSVREHISLPYESHVTSHYAFSVACSHS